MGLGTRTRRARAQAGGRRRIKARAAGGTKRRVGRKGPKRTSKTKRRERRGRSRRVRKQRGRGIGASSMRGPTNPLLEAGKDLLSNRDVRDADGHKFRSELEQAVRRVEGWEDEVKRIQDHTQSMAEDDPEYRTFERKLERITLPGLRDAERKLRLAIQAVEGQMDRFVSMRESKERIDRHEAERRREEREAQEAEAAEAARAAAEHRAREEAHARSAADSARRERARQQHSRRARAGPKSWGQWLRGEIPEDAPRLEDQFSDDE